MMGRGSGGVKRWGAEREGKGYKRRVAHQQQEAASELQLGQ